MHEKLQRWRRHSERENEDDPCNNTYTRKKEGPQPLHKPVGKKIRDHLNMKLERGRIH